MTDAAVKQTILTVDGVTVEMSDTAAQIVQRHQNRLETDLKAANDKLVAQATEAVQAKDAAEKAALKAKTDIEAKDAEIVTLKKQLQDAQVTPAKLDELVKDRDDVVTKAKAVLGDALVKDGKSNAEMRRQVVDHKLGEVAKDWTDEQVKASFDTLTAGAAANTTDTSRLISAAFSGKPVGGPSAQTAKMYDAYSQRISNAWRGPEAK